MSQLLCESQKSKLQYERPFYILYVFGLRAGGMRFQFLLFQKQQILIPELTLRGTCRVHENTHIRVSYSPPIHYYIQG